jgi:S-methylmethionine-dependent homocysteine/selenocysteine methylase
MNQAKYRDDLPQLGDQLFLTDSGLETWLLFQQGVDLPDFAAFPLLDDKAGRARIAGYLRRHALIAAEAGLGFVLETPTWRANAGWGEGLGYDAAGLAKNNAAAVELLFELREEFETASSPFVISGQMGPRADGYAPEASLSADEAADFHAAQIGTLADAGADFVSALTMPQTSEAVGIVRAAQAAGIPAVISFTLETDGRLPSGETLPDAIEAVDSATGAGPAYYMINCAHPTHFEHVVASGAPALQRVRALRANASTKSHEELDNSTELDDGDPAELAAQYRALREALPQVTILGGCCGTDHRHVAAICLACGA